MSLAVSSYDPNALLPKVGTHWVWEIDKPHARELIEITEVFWNGEEWWVRSRNLMRPVWRLGLGLTHETLTHETLNDLGRFWEAVVPVNGGRRGLTEHRPPVTA